MKIVPVPATITVSSLIAGTYAPPAVRRAHHDRDLRDPLRRHPRLVEEDPAEVVPVREHLRLQRQKRPARVDQVDARQPVLLGHLLRPQMLLHRQREIRAALHRRVVRDDHALAPLDRRRSPSRSPPTARRRRTRPTPPARSAPETPSPDRRAGRSAHAPAASRASDAAPASARRRRRRPAPSARATRRPAPPSAHAGARRRRSARARFPARPRREPTRAFGAIRHAVVDESQSPLAAARRGDRRRGRRRDRRRRARPQLDEEPGASLTTRRRRRPRPRRTGTTGTTTTPAPLDRPGCDQRDLRGHPAARRHARRPEPRRSAWSCSKTRSARSATSGASRPCPTVVDAVRAAPGRSSSSTGASRSSGRTRSSACARSSPPACRTSSGT